MTTKSFLAALSAVCLISEIVFGVLNEPMWMLSFMIGAVVYNAAYLIVKEIEKLKK